MVFISRPSNRYLFYPSGNPTIPLYPPLPQSRPLPIGLEDFAAALERTAALDLSQRFVSGSLGCPGLFYAHFHFFLAGQRFGHGPGITSFVKSMAGLSDRPSIFARLAFLADKKRNKPKRAKDLSFLNAFLVSGSDWNGSLSCLNFIFTDYLLAWGFYLVLGWPRR